LVVAVAPDGKVAPAPDEGPANVTVTPVSGLPPASRTSAINGLEKTVLTAVPCPDPDETVTVAGPPGVFVNENVAGVATPVTVAVTENAPAVPFAVIATDACPEMFVVGFAPAGNVTRALELARDSDLRLNRLSSVTDPLTRNRRVECESNVSENRVEGRKDKT
jgi:hypothetical protein